MIFQTEHKLSVTVKINYCIVMIESSRWVSLFAVTAGLCSFFFPPLELLLKNLSYVSHLYATFCCPNNL